MNAEATSEQDKAPPTRTGKGKANTVPVRRNVNYERGAMMVWDGLDRRSDNHSERIAVLESELIAVKNSNSEILKQLQAIHTELTRYKGFVGGVVFVVTGVITCIGYLWQR